MSSVEIPVGKFPPPGPLIPEAGNAAHAVQFYSDDEFVLDYVSRLLGAALGAGDAAIVIAAKAHREGLWQRLTSCGFDLSAITRRGRLIDLDAAETLAQVTADGALDSLRFLDFMGSQIARAGAAARDHRRVVIFGEMVTLLWAQGKADATLELEQLWNRLAEKQIFFLQCAYPISSFCRPEHSTPLLDICAEHNSVIPVESYTSLRDEGDRLRLIAELQQKAQALQSAMAEQARVQEALRESQEQLRRSHDELEDRVRARAQELGQAENLLRKLSHTLLSLRDEERRRIARELHDSTGQILAALQLNLAAAQQDAAALAQRPSRQVARALKKKLAEGIYFADQAINEIRTMSYLLHPPMLDETGLRVALEWFVAGFAERAGFAIDLRLPGNLERLPRDMELAIFRIVQEALSHIYRHSGSKTASIELKREPDKIGLLIQDAGRFLANEELDEPEGGMTKIGVGVLGMRERVRQFGGQFELVSTDSGTRLIVSFPLTLASSSEAPTLSEEDPGGFQTVKLFDIAG
jgi:signal transduction histidine kinase